MDRLEAALFLSGITRLSIDDERFPWEADMMSAEATLLNLSAEQLIELID